LSVHQCWVKGATEAAASPNFLRGADLVFGFGFPKSTKTFVLAKLQKFWDMFWIFVKKILQMALKSFYKSTFKKMGSIEIVMSSVRLSVRYFRPV
jgi:hypothetical protein